MPRRVHITGSASPECDPDLLRWAEDALKAFLGQHLRAGGSLIAQIGGEPRHPKDPELPLIFDWLAIESAVEALRAGEIEPSAEDPVLILRGSQRGFGQMPASRRDLYDELVARGAVDLKLLNDTWRSGALIRQAQARLGDVLLILSGGAGGRASCRYLRRARTRRRPLARRSRLLPRRWLAGRHRPRQKGAGRRLIILLARARRRRGGSAGGAAGGALPARRSRACRF